MKKIIKSLLVLTLVAVTVTGATKAWFTSTVSAADNVITAGTLFLGLGTTADLTTSGPAYTLAYDQLLDDGGVQNNVANFPALENLYPGESRVIYFTAYNRGTLPLNFRFAFDGNWTDLPNHTSDTGLATRVAITRIDRIATSGWAPGEYGPYNINNWLVGNGYAWDSQAVVGTWWNTPWATYRTEGSELGSKEFQVYKVTFQLDSDAPNAYQGGTFEYSITADAKQTNAAW